MRPRGHVQLFSIGLVCLAAANPLKCADDVPTPIPKPEVPTIRTPETSLPGGGGTGATQTGDELSRLTTESDSDRQVVCFGISLLNSEGFPPTVDSFEERLFYRFGEALYDQTTRGQVEKAYELLGQASAGDIDLVETACF